MYGTIACYNGAVTAGAEAALNAVADPDFTIQNSNFVFTSRYPLLAAALVGASVKYGRYLTSQWAIQGFPRIYAANRGATPPSLPIWDLFLNKAVVLPEDQQLQILASNNLATGTEAEAAVLQVGSPGWTRGEPASIPGGWDVVLHATCPVTNVAGAWVENNPFTFDQPPLGGSYCVLGTAVVGAGAYAYRWVFPRSPNYQGRRLRPGGLVQTAFGNSPPYGMMDAFKHWGPQGAFWTFEQPTLGILGQAAGLVTYDVFMLCRFLGEGSDPVTAFVNQQNQAA